MNLEVNIIHGTHEYRVGKLLTVGRPALKAISVPCLPLLPSVFDSERRVKQFSCRPRPPRTHTHIVRPQHTRVQILRFAALRHSQIGNRNGQQNGVRNNTNGDRKGRETREKRRESEARGVRIVLYICRCN